MTVGRLASGLAPKHPRGSIPTIAGTAFRLTLRPRLRPSRAEEVSAERFDFVLTRAQLPRPTSEASLDLTDVGVG